MVDTQEQYSWRPCLVITSMAKSEHEEGADNSDDVKQVIETLERECGISQYVIQDNLNKTHPIGRPEKYGKQLRLVQTKEKLQLSLTRHRNWTAQIC